MIERAWCLVLMMALPAVADDETPESEPPPPITWRNEQPGWGMGLRYGPEGPGASLRGWSSAALSIDVDAGLQLRSQRLDEASELWAPVAETTLWANVAPRIRVYGSERTDVLVVPSAAVHTQSTKVGDQASEMTRVQGSLGVAVDRWVAPGVSITGRIDALQLGVERFLYQGDTSTSRLVGLQLSPSVAVHVYPRLRKPTSDR